MIKSIHISESMHTLCMENGSIVVLSKKGIEVFRDFDAAIKASAPAASFLAWPKPAAKPGDWLTDTMMFLGDGTHVSLEYEERINAVEVFHVEISGRSRITNGTYTSQAAAREAAEAWAEEYLNARERDAGMIFTECCEKWSVGRPEEMKQFVESLSRICNEKVLDAYQDCLDALLNDGELLGEREAADYIARKISELEKK